MAALMQRQRACANWQQAWMRHCITTIVKHNMMDHLRNFVLKNSSYMSRSVSNYDRQIYRLCKKKSLVRVEKETGTPRKFYTRAHNTHTQRTARREKSSSTNGDAPPGCRVDTRIAAVSEMVFQQGSVKNLT